MPPQIVSERAMKAQAQLLLQAALRQLQTHFLWACPQRETHVCAKHCLLFPSLSSSDQSFKTKQKVWRAQPTATSYVENNPKLSIKGKKGQRGLDTDPDL